LLTRDDALITPSAMAVKLLANQIQQAQKTIKEFDVRIAEAMKQHPDAHLFTSLRGAGDALAPRLLCAFGSQRDRWENAESLASFSGIAPVTYQSGKSRGAVGDSHVPSISGRLSTNLPTVRDGIARGAKPDIACSATAG
jgi:transposase